MLPGIDRNLPDYYATELSQTLPSRVWLNPVWKRTCHFETVVFNTEKAGFWLRCWFTPTVNHRGLEYTLVHRWVTAAQRNHPVPKQPLSVSCQNPNHKGNTARTASLNELSLERRRDKPHQEWHNISFDNTDVGFFRSNSSIVQTFSFFNSVL